MLPELLRPVQEGHDMGTHADAVGIKLGGRCAGGDAVLHCPDDGIMVECVGGHIHEGIGCTVNHLAAVGTPQEGDPSWMPEPVSDVSTISASPTTSS